MFISEVQQRSNASPLSQLVEKWHGREIKPLFQEGGSPEHERVARDAFLIGLIGILIFSAAIGALIAGLMGASPIIGAIVGVIGVPLTIWIIDMLMRRGPPPLPQPLPL